MADTQPPNRPRGPCTPPEGYELIARLGSSLSGNEIWSARGPGGGRVVLKFLRLSPGVADVDERALRLMKDIRHPHLEALFASWVREGYLILAMELASGTLLDRLHEAQGQGLAGIPAAELLEYMREAAEGLDYLHRQGLTHGDVKPTNLVLVGGRVKVAECGRAISWDGARSGIAFSFTPAYAAPELLQRRVTPGSDQYALAVTYCQLRGGRLPFEGSLIELIDGHRDHPPDLSMVPEAERPALERALVKKPEERWPSCRAFVEALAAVGGGPGEPPP
jgi:serine/threonine-protein kinase